MKFKWFVALALFLVTIAGASATALPIAQQLIASTSAGPSSVNDWFAQNFTVNSSTNVSYIAVEVVKTGNPTGNQTFSLRTGTGSGPSASRLCTGAFWTIPRSSIPSGTSWINLTLENTSCPVTTNTNYFIVMEGAYTSSGNDIAWRVETTSVLASGMRWTSTNAGSTWSTTATQDFKFIVYTGGLIPPQTNLSITAIDAYNSTAITSFNASIVWNGTTTTWSTTNGTIQTNLSVNSTLPANITVTPTQTNYFDFAQTFTNYANSTLQFNATPYTLVRVIAFNGTAINNFSFNWSGPYYSGNSTTTNGIAYVPVFNGTYSVTIYDANQAGTNYASTIANLTGSLYLQAYNFTGLYFTNSFLFTFYNETTDTQLTQNVTLQLISPVFAANYTVSGGTYNATLLMPADYQIIYWVDPAVPREYYTTLTNQSVQSLRLYTIDDDLSDVYLPRARDSNGEACGNQTVSLLRYFINGNAYRVVQMALTDTNGLAVLNVQPNIINYKLQFSGSCGDFTSDPQKMTSATDTFTISDSQSPLTPIAESMGVSRSLTYINSTQTIVFNWADSSNVVTQACLKVDKLLVGVRTTVFDSCDSSPSGSLIYTINDTNQTAYYATSTITLNVAYSTYSDSISVNFNTNYQVFGMAGVFLTLLVVILFAMFGLGSTETTVLFGLGAIVLMGVFGFIAWNWSYFIGMIVVGFIILYKMRT